MSSRRKFLKALAGTLAATVPLSAFRFLSPAEVRASIKGSRIRWAFVVDTTKCVGCGFCVKACKKENEVPYDAPITRTWVERYVITKDGKAHIDTPKGGRDGFTSPKIREEVIPPEEITKAFFVPKLCNQCENPACVQVCPVGASYQTPEGVVLIDRKWCIGCGYCIMACPYGVRFFHPVYKVADKCTFCYHRISKGMKTACVQACPFGARMIGNLKDPNDPVTKIVLTQRVAVLKDEYGTKPQVYYIGFDFNVR
ncbi:4Fe-4S dicluster domain-containing protein [Thermosulfuriphilus ammonigenes]|uniref:4Fe-4S dicluster domain-containing protein n=1 Tax=Thermosulfuriphilus ammonigenes TaxID=1936021 RepID=A0A6G7PXQ3_9BACT|nr:4Fe-4S dicluster domain-containing protein [Thermosulfuriphilus ammonigenes]MBA2849404.1 Fe-S-cluster-containing dehydrogenase component [Thermosulfuriphilus ammonigenes]QIJ72475.1 4Fe-4S dicluster domain-containing protein [Thermosulfuriphilus ammonigenes]